MKERSNQPFIDALLSDEEGRAKAFRILDAIAELVEAQRDRVKNDDRRQQEEHLTHQLAHAEREQVVNKILGGETQ